MKSDGTAKTSFAKLCNCTKNHFARWTDGWIVGKIQIFYLFVSEYESAIVYCIAAIEREITSLSTLADTVTFPLAMQKHGGGCNYSLKKCGIDH